MLLAHALTLQLLAQEATPSRALPRYDDLRCVTLSARETHAYGRHLFACVNHRTGHILGALLSRRGRVACAVTGQVQGSCLTVTICAQTASQCQ